jgi:hypothetical protein
MPSSSAQVLLQSRGSTRPFYTPKSKPRYRITNLTDYFSIDLKELKTYQQVYVYLIPILSNLGFVNIIVVIVRLHWFEKHLRAVCNATYPDLTNLADRVLILWRIL